MPEPHVVIIGAGITGLLVAHGLQKDGIRVSVFDKEPAPSAARARTWGISLHWGFDLLQRCLPDAHFQRLRDTCCDPHFDSGDYSEVTIVNGETGALIKNVPMHAKVHRVSRAKFRALCAEGVHVVHGKTLQDLSYDDAGATVTAHFADGTASAPAHLLVGCDGASSAVRSLILPPAEAQATLAPWTAVNVQATYGNAAVATRVRQLNPIIAIGVHPQGHVSILTILDATNPDPATWAFQVVNTWTRQPGEDAQPLELAEFKQMAGMWCEPFRSAMLNLPDDTVIARNKIAYWETRPWDTRNGRVVIAGDAAHPMSFQRGQGGNHAIESAGRLVEHVAKAFRGEQTLGQAAQAYQDEVVTRGSDEVRNSIVNSTMLHDWDQLQRSPLMTRGIEHNQS